MLNCIIKPAASYGGITPMDEYAGSPLRLGATNTSHGADTVLDDDGGNGWIFTHYCTVGELTQPLFLQPPGT